MRTFKLESSMKIDIQWKIRQRFFFELLMWNAYFESVWLVFLQMFFKWLLIVVSSVLVTTFISWISFFRKLHGFVISNSSWASNCLVTATISASELFTYLHKYQPRDSYELLIFVVISSSTCSILSLCFPQDGHESHGFEEYV